MNKKIDAINDMRIISEDFINKKISYGIFQTKMSPYLGGTFDPLDDEIKDLSPKLQNEVKFYSKFLGGEFGEFNTLLPDTNSTTSINNYRERYANEYRKIKKV